MDERTKQEDIATVQTLSKLPENTNKISKLELKRHNHPSDAWCAVHNYVLDITKFAKRHPGGDLILLAAGSDATVLFETYHPKGISTSVVKKLIVGQMAQGEQFESYYSWESEFYPTLKRRVVDRLEELKLSRRGGSGSIFVKGAFFLFGFWFCLWKMIVTIDFIYALLWSIAMGIFASFVGTCIQHDGNHGAFSNFRIINKIAGWTLDMIGASGFTWEIQHMLGHHPYTNVLDCAEDKRKQSGLDAGMTIKDQESDPDVFSSFPLMRMHPEHEASWYHKYQHLYAPLLFALMTLAKVLQQDFEVATQKRLYHIDATCRYGSNLNVLRFWSMKAITMIYMVGLPCYSHGLFKGLVIFFIGHVACGEMLATMFIVNHVIEGVSFGRKNIISVDGTGDNSAQPTTAQGVTPMLATRESAKKANKNIAEVPLNDWAAVQCQTSVNWSAGSWFFNHFSGGLSHQIEHHLFPSICHTNYVHLHDVVKQTCEEFGVPYQAEPSLFTAYGKMLSHLRYLGNEGSKLKLS